MALVGNMIHDSLRGDPSIVIYDMFAAVFSMLSLFYLVPVTIKEEFAFHPLIMIVLDFLNTLFFLCGAIAMAGYLGVHSCDNQVSLTPSKTTAVSKLMQFFVEICPQQQGHQWLRQSLQAL